MMTALFMYWTINCILLGYYIGEEKAEITLKENIFIYVMISVFGTLFLVQEIFLKLTKTFSNWRNKKK
jgi:hypothetical protein